MRRKLDVGGTLTQIFQTYGDQAGVLLPVAFVLYLLVAVVNALLVGSLILLPLGFAVSVVARPSTRGWSSAWSRTCRMGGATLRSAS